MYVHMHGPVHVHMNVPMYVHMNVPDYVCMQYMHAWYKTKKMRVCPVTRKEHCFYS